MAEMHPYRKNDLFQRLNAYLGKTLGEADSNNVFDRTIKHPKITGIAGDVVEQSILGYPADSDQRRRGSIGLRKVDDFFIQQPENFSER